MTGLINQNRSNSDLWRKKVNDLLNASNSIQHIAEIRELLVKFCFCVLQSQYISQPSLVNNKEKTLEIKGDKGKTNILIKEEWVIWFNEHLSYKTAITARVVRTNCSSLRIPNHPQVETICGVLAGFIITLELKLTPNQTQLSIQLSKAFLHNNLKKSIPSLNPYSTLRWTHQLAS